MQGDDIAIRAEGLERRFGTVRALAGVDLEVPAGTVFGLLGPNGAGKTTTIRILTTLVRPDAGRAWVAGHDVVRESALVRSAIGLAGQLAAVDDHLTGTENLAMVGRLNHLGRAEARRRAGELLERFGLTGAADRQARTYSGGMRRRLDLAASLVGGPPVLFLDEPTSGLDPLSRLALWEEIRRLRAEKTTLLLTTQNLEEADRLADRIAVIDHGRLVAEGSPSELKSQVGGNRLFLRTAEPADMKRAAESLADIDAGAREDPGRGELIVPAPTGISIVVEAARRADAAGIELAELSLRGPTLDEVFLALTGDGAKPPRVLARPPVGRSPGAPIVAPKSPTSPRGGGRAVGDAVVMTKRNLYRYLRIPSLMAFSVVQPILFVLLFTYAFGGAIHVPGVTYVDFLLPGTFVLALAFGASQTGIALAQDLTSGMIDRFRSLPMARSAVLAGRTGAEAVRNLFAVSLMIGIGALVGFRFHAGALPALGAVGLAVAVGFALSWVSALIGLAVRDAETAQVASLMPIIVLIFSSSTFVPVATMPGWLEGFAKINPITKAVNAMRALSLGGPTSTPVWEAIAWVAGILVVFVPLAVQRYRRTTA